MHQLQWLAAIEELGDINQSAPKNVLDQDEYEQYAYAYLGHATSRWTPRRAG